MLFVFVLICTAILVIQLMYRLGDRNQKQIQIYITLNLRL